MERWIATVRVGSFALLLTACVAIGVGDGGPVGLFLLLGALLVFATGNLLILVRFGDGRVRSYYEAHRRNTALRVAFRSASLLARADALLRALIAVAIVLLVVLTLSRRL